MDETSKSKKLWGPVEKSVLQGKGIDIGSGPDPITPEARAFDVQDGEALGRILDLEEDDSLSTEQLDNQVQKAQEQLIALKRAQEQLEKQKRELEELSRRQEGQSQEVRAISWRAQNRLHRRYTRLLARRLQRNKAMVAVARELCGFIWELLRTQPCYQAQSRSV